MIGRSPFIKPFLFLATFLHQFGNVNTTVENENPLSYFTPGFTFSAGFPNDGEDLCKGHPFCVQAFAYETQTHETVLQIERTLEDVPGSSVFNTIQCREEQYYTQETNAKCKANSLIKHYTEEAIDIEARSRAWQYTFREMSYLNKNARDLMTFLIDNQGFYKSYIRFKDKCEDKYFNAEHTRQLAAITKAEYPAIFKHFNNTFFKREFDKNMQRDVLLAKSRGQRLYFDYTILKYLIQSLDIQLNSSENYNQFYTLVSKDNIDTRFYRASLRFKGQPLKNIEKLEKEFSEMSKQAITSEDRNLAILISIFSFIFVAGAVDMINKTRKTNQQETNRPQLR